jgi:esterase/lipase
MARAKEAHEQDITLNQLMCNILRAYVEGKTNFDFEAAAQEERRKNRQKRYDERSNNTQIEERLISAVASVVDEVTIPTLTEFGEAYTNWQTNYRGTISSSTLIQDGFDQADENEGR